MTQAAIDKIIHAHTPLTLSHIADGAVPLLLSDIVRASDGDQTNRKTAYIAQDDAAMAALVDTIPFYAPELEIVSFPAWDCLPYDRTSPSQSISAERMAALHALQFPAHPDRPQLLLTTVHAVMQRVLTPFRIRQIGLELKIGMDLPREKLLSRLTMQGYQRNDMVADSGEYAVRGNLIDILPSGSKSGVRLDFFGDELETMRLFDPGSQRTTGEIDRLVLLPAREALLNDDNIKRFRTAWRTQFGAVATNDPLYQAISEGRPMAGMEHWLPYMEESLGTIFDHLGDNPLILADHASHNAAQQRFEAIEDYYQNRKSAMEDKPGSFRPIAPGKLYYSRDEWDAIGTAHNIHQLTPFAEPESDISLDLNLPAARNFSAERARGDNIYKALSAHIAELKRNGRHVIIASYSEGARARLCDMLRENKVTGLAEAQSWPEALSLAQKGHIAMAILAEAHGFQSGDFELLTEQDILGDRLVQQETPSEIRRRLFG